jgi:hypothetical protein
MHKRVVQVLWAVGVMSCLFPSGSEGAQTVVKTEVHGQTLALPQWPDLRFRPRIC